MVFEFEIRWLVEFEIKNLEKYNKKLEWISSLWWRNFSKTRSFAYIRFKFTQIYIFLFLIWFLIFIKKLGKIWLNPRSKFKLCGEIIILKFSRLIVPYNLTVVFNQLNFSFLTAHNPQQLFSQLTAHNSLGMTTGWVWQKPARDHTRDTRPNPPAGEKSHPRPHPPGFGPPAGLSKVEVNSMKKSRRIKTPRKEHGWWVRWHYVTCGRYCWVKPKIWGWREFRWTGWAKTIKI
jgi:hypothetical protein